MAEPAAGIILLVVFTVLVVFANVWFSRPSQRAGSTQPPGRQQDVHAC
jgi:hypothetical protein